GTNLAVHGPCAFAMYRQVEVAGPNWEDLNGAWTAQNNPWLAYAPDLGQLRLAHGTSQGVVWQHEPALYTRNGVAPQWSFTVNTDFGDPYVLKTLQHRRIEHDGTSPTNVLNWSIFDDRGVPWASGTAPLISTGTGRQVATISPHFTAATMRIRMTGIHPVQILGWQDEVVPLDVLPDPISSEVPMNQRAEAPNGNKYGSLDGTSHVTVIPAPSDAFTGSGPYYRVGTVAVFNADNAGVVVNVYINNGSGTRTQIDSQLLDASPPTTVD